MFTIFHKITLDRRDGIAYIEGMSMYETDDHYIIQYGERWTRFVHMFYSETGWYWYTTDTHGTRRTTEYLNHLTNQSR